MVTIIANPERADPSLRLVGENHMRASQLVNALCLLATGLMLLSPAAALGQSTPSAQANAQSTSDYDALDNDILARELGNLRMTELLDTLAKDEHNDAVDLLVIQVQKAMAEGLACTELRDREEALDRAIALQDHVVEALAKGDDKLKYFRAAMDRIIMEGITKSAPYVERHRYFLARGGDRAKIAAATKAPYDLLKKVVREMEMDVMAWERDTNRVTDVGALEDLLGEAKYRGAWVCYFRGLGLSGLADQDEERQTVLRRCVEYARLFAEAEDNAVGVKLECLGLMGRAYIELGEYDKARQYFGRASDAKLAPEMQRDLLFEVVKSYIRQGDADAADKALNDYFARLQKIVPPAGQFAVDFQGMLLKRQVALVRAEQAKDSKQADQFGAQANDAVVQLISKYPGHRDDIEKIITPSLEEADVLKLTPAQLYAAMGVLLRSAAPRTATGPSSTTAPGNPEAAEKLEGKCRAILDSKQASPEQRAPAIYYLAVLRGINGGNQEAADLSLQFLASYPGSDKALDIAVFAWQNLQAVMDNRRVTSVKAAAETIGQDFVEKMLKVLQVLQKWSGDAKVKNLDLDYHLGRTLQVLGKDEEAVEAFNRIPPSNELYFPSRYDVLMSKCGLAVNEKYKDLIARRALANQLLVELADYRDKASQYTSPNERRQNLVRTYAVEADLYRVELLDHVLKRNDEASREAQAALDRWKDVNPQTYRQVQQTAIVTLLPSNPGKAREVLLQSKMGPEVIQLVVESLRKEIDDIRIDDPVSEKLKAAQDAYRPVAQQLYDAMAADSPPEQTYFFKQAMAYALENGSPDEVAKAAEMFGELSGMSRRFTQEAAARGERRGEDAANVWGLARCAAKLGQNDKATQYYDELARGLPEKSHQWWAAQLERMRLLLKVNQSDPKAMPDLLQGIKVLQFMDSNLGGYLRQFNSLSGEMQAAAGKAK